MAHQRMAVVDANNNVVNVVVYDTDSTWTPPEGTRLIQVPQDGLLGKGNASPGGKWDGKKLKFLPAADLDEEPKAKKSWAKKK